MLAYTVTVYLFDSFIFMVGILIYAIYAIYLITRFIQNLLGLVQRTVWSLLGLG